MGGQTQESLNSNLLTPEALVDFIEELRHVGFNIGMAEYIAAQDLLLMLTSRGENLNNPQRVSSLFGPLLCSSPAEQDTFPEFYQRWYERQKAKLSAREIPHEETMAETLEDTAKRGLRWEWILFTLGVIVLVLAAWFVSRNFVRAELQLPSGPNSPPDTTGDTTPLIQLASVALGILGIAYFAWWAWWRRTANQFLQRRQSQETPDIKRISITTSDEVLYPALTFLSLARLFRQRVHVVSKDINVLTTVEKSVESGGWLNPVYDQLLIPPEYLVLVDRRSRFDHLAEFMDGMVKRLEEDGVFITAYTFDGDPRLCFPLRGNGVPQSLNELAARHENMRLIIFTEAQGLLSPVSGRLSPWSRLFNRWVHRSVLIPEATEYWGITEHELQREFTVLPGTTDGLATFMYIIQGQEKSGEINTWADSALPQIVQERPQRWLEKDAPSASQIDSLLNELEFYLGKDGYTWLKACAVYPELQWQITITLGQLLKDKNGKPILESKRLIDLARLPWFRYGVMPDWLRTRLILDLEANQEEEIRAVLEALLVTAVQGHGESLDLEVAYEQRDWTSRLARPLLRLLQQESSSEGPVQDHVYLDFMLQRLNLAVRVPEAFRRQLFVRVGDQTGWRVLLQWTIAHLLVVCAIIICSLLFPVSNRSLNSVFVINSFLGLLLGLVQWLVLRRFWKLNGLLWVGVCMFGINVTSLISIPLGDVPLYGSKLGFLNLTVISLAQAGLLSRKQVRPASLWWLGGLTSGVISSIFLYFFKLDNGFSTNWHMIVFYVTSTSLYSFISGWIILELLRHKVRKFTWLLRASWVLSNAAGYSVGVLLAIAIAIGASLDSSQITGNVIVGSIWGLIIVLSQWSLLRSYHLRMARYWFWVTLLPTIGGFALLMQLTSGLSSEEMFSSVSIVSTIGLGVLLSLTQTFVWYRNGLTPYQLLIWFLSSAVGISLMFMVLYTEAAGLNNITNPTMDQILIIFFIPALLYGLVSAWPLKPFVEKIIQIDRRL